MTDGSQTAVLEARLASKAKAGLRDVRFDLANALGMPVETISKEINALYDAVERGDAEPLDFGDGATR